MDKDRENRIYVGSLNRRLEKETKRSISKIMLAIETYTDYQNLDTLQKSLVRDTVLNQVNRLVRVTNNFNTIVFSGPENITE